MQIEKTKSDIKIFNPDFVTDQEGKIKSVILDYGTYRKIEELLLDYGLAKAMEEALEDEEFDIESAKKLVAF